MKSILLVVVLSLLMAPTLADPLSVSPPKALQLTVYNGNFALVKDTRSIDLTAGVNSIAIEDVAARIDPTSILFKSITSPNSVAILEQNYQYDLISPNTILDKSIGRQVVYTQFHDNTSSQMSGTLLSGPTNGGVVIRQTNGTIQLNPSGTASVDALPEGLHPRPTLNWLLKSDKAGAQDAQISYITDGLGWKADYVALVNKDDSMLDLAGWVTLNNESGATYKDAKLTLMAGDVRRVQPQEGMFDRKVAYAAMADITAAPQFQEKSFFEYHMYTMERPTTVSNNETKQLSLLNASSVPTKKEMIYDARGDWFRNWWYPGRTDGDPGSGYDTSNYHKVNVVLQIENSKANHMGMPLPKGRVRVYKLDDQGSQQFIGEDMIDHTPRDEKVRLYVGDAFDVVGDYKRTDYQKISANVVEESFEVKIRNHKETPVDVKVVDHVWSDWTVKAKSQDYVKKDASTIEFPVTVPKDGETTVTYTIRTKW